MIELLSKEEFRGLSRTRQQEYAEMAIFKLIQDREEGGVTLQELRTATPFAVSTISKYLDVLLAKRQVFKVSRGSVAFYFPNGTPVHEISHKEVNVGKRTYNISLIQNNLGKNVYVQELETDGLGLKRLMGGVMIPIGSALAISALIQKVAKEKAELTE